MIPQYAGIRPQGASFCMQEQTHIYKKDTKIVMVSVSFFVRLKRKVGKYAFSEFKEEYLPAGAHLEAETYSSKMVQELFDS